MSQAITVLTVADLHRGKALYDLLRTAIAPHRPDILALVGDFLDATGEQQGKLTTEECAGFLSLLPCPETIFVRGNHEDSGWFAFLRPAGDRRLPVPDEPWRRPL
jgi:metallophosphoesterase superfamily enzyme